MTNRYERLCRYLLSLVTAARGAARGQGLVEYAAILSFIAACMVVAELYLQPHLNLTLNTVANSFP
jgi:Flp pilus assembly pilin Flp